MRALGALLVLVALAGHAAAQVPGGLPTSPGIQVTMDDPATGTVVPIGGSGSVPLVVRVVLSNMVCTAEATVPVSLALTESAVAGIVTTLPATTEVKVPAGNYVSTTTGSGSTNVTVLFTVGSSAPGNHDHKVMVKATGPAALPGGCQAIGTPTPTDTEKQVGIKTGPAAPAATASPTATSATSVSASSQESFFLPMQVQVAVLAGLALLLRRR